MSACHFINAKVNEHMRGKELPLTKNVLTGLQNWFNRIKHKESSGELFKCSPYVVKAVAEALMASYGSIKNPETPALASYEQFSMKKFPADGNPETLKFMFTLFNGGKALGSKVKIAKFYLILNYELQDVQEGGDALSIYHKVVAGIKKGLSTHKLGENGFKPTPGGQYFNAHENHNETFKIIEDAINQSGANTSSQVLSIGISVDPDQFYDANTDKYEVEGPKNLFDLKMLIAWLQKLINDHPLLSYVEDAIRVGDVAGWQQWCQIVKDNYEHV